MSVEEYTRAINRWSVRREPRRGGKEQDYTEKNEIDHYEYVESSTMHQLKKTRVCSPSQARALPRRSVRHRIAWEK